MKFSNSWLKQYIDSGLDPESIGARLTLAGLELDGIEAAAPEFSGVVVARIEAIEPHPDAEKLRVCRVNDGIRDDLQVICGAKNARQGLVTALATVGAELPGGMKIKKAKLRGVESFGMLCSTSELGMDESSDGILELPDDVPIGTSIRDYFDLDDSIYDVDLTPNRADCLSLRGIARELGTLTGAGVSGFDVVNVAPQIDDHFDIAVDAAEKCPVYCGRVIKAINPAAETPFWMSERLRRSGVRSLHPVVDITNYVMLELGQPMHAFDLSKLSGSVRVRDAVEGERVALLDGKTIDLKAGSLVIADGSGPLALAGVMGGESTAVTASTVDLFLESAFFPPDSQAGAARTYGLHTDSSHRFERGVDFRLQRSAIERATALILQICGGAPGPVTVINDESLLPALTPIILREHQIGRRIGIRFEAEDVERILSALGCRVSTTDVGWSVEPPSYRFDLRIEVDLIEELVRVHGYDKLPSTPRSWAPVITKQDEGRVALSSLKDRLNSLGYQEVITYSFVDSGTEEALNPGASQLALANPISSDLGVMRSTIWSGLTKVVGYNQRRQQSRVRIFESGLVFLGGVGELAQESRLAGAISGRLNDENWYEKPRSCDFYDLKGDVDALFEMLGKSAEWAPASHPALHPGQSAEILVGGARVGWAGKIHPTAAKLLDLEPNLYLFELDAAKLTERAVPKFSELSRFPSVRRDLALLVEQEVSFARIEASIRALSIAMIADVQLFDIYAGQGVQAGFKSVALGLILQDFSRTLEDRDVDQIIERVLLQLKADVGASLRV